MLLLLWKKNWQEAGRNSHGMGNLPRRMASLIFLKNPELADYTAGSRVCGFDSHYFKQHREELPPNGDFVEIKGSRLHYVDDGSQDDPAVVFIHGASGNLEDHRMVYQHRLNETLRVIFP